jgi:hypothetical protein
MGNNATAKLSYGVEVKESFELPWDLSGDISISHWWESVKFSSERPQSREPGDVTLAAREAEYLDALRIWKSNNPVPVEEVRHCWSDEPMIILAIKSVEIDWGYVELITPDFMIVTDAKKQVLLDFIDEFKIETTGEEPGWLLTAYWG